MSNNVAFRIIDANFNRAREALRVMEEYARFVLDDAALASEVKGLRHDLGRSITAFEERGQQAMQPGETESLGAGAEISPGQSDPVIRHRDIVGDVGRNVTTPGEYERADLGHVAQAAGKRLSEALRALEEYGKTIRPDFAAAIESLRYRGYELERRIGLVTTARKRFSGIRLYVLITEALCQSDWFATAEAVLRGGADCLQLREKGLPDRELLERARRLAELCHEHEALLIINDRPDIAALSGADGVHVGQDDLSVAQARRVVPATAVVGISTHTRGQLDAAVEAAPDYIAVGPMFATVTKPQEYLAGPPALTAARKRTALPLVAIGGVGEPNAAEVLAAAPCCLCVCRSVVSQTDSEAAAARLRELIDGAANTR